MLPIIMLPDGDLRIVLHLVPFWILTIWGSVHTKDTLYLAPMGCLLQGCWEIGVEYKSQIELTKDTPYLTLVGELWGVFSKDLGENLSQNIDQSLNKQKTRSPLTKSNGWAVGLGCLLQKFGRVDLSYNGTTTLY